MIARLGVWVINKSRLDGSIVYQNNKPRRYITTHKGTYNNENIVYNWIPSHVDYRLNDDESNLAFYFNSEFKDCQASRK